MLDHGDDDFALPEVPDKPRFPPVAIPGPKADSLPGEVYNLFVRQALAALPKRANLGNIGGGCEDHRNWKRWTQRTQLKACSARRWLSCTI